MAAALALTVDAAGVDEASSEDGAAAVDSAVGGAGAPDHRDLGYRRTHGTTHVQNHSLASHQSRAQDSAANTPSLPSQSRARFSCASIRKGIPPSIRVKSVWSSGIITLPISLGK